MNGCVYIFLCALLCSTCFSQILRRQKRIVGGRAAAQPPKDDPVVYVAKSDREARIHGIRDPNDGFYVFRGIRYAQPPVGQNRFQRPKPFHMEGEIHAKKWGSPCPQPSPDNATQIIGSEDCLYLNVFTPKLPDATDGYPVLIWIHGGGFRRGSACQYEMRNLIKKQMIVVSIQYRLGSLGFLSTGTKELPGNIGMFDMILAVNWVKDHIEYFGGNPKHIIAFGHGTGASSAFMLSLSTFLKDTFSGLIAMSGSILSHFAIDKNPVNTAEYIASRNGCPVNNSVEMIRCLQDLPVEKIIQIDSHLESIKMGIQGFVSGLSTLLGPGPVIEGSDDGRALPNFITDTPEDSLRLGKFPAVPLLTGVVKDETAGAIFGKYREEVENKLRTVPNFLNQQLLPSLQSTISVFDNNRRFMPEAFTNYINVLRNGNNADASCSKVAEVTGDSLFNVPAFLTVDHWAKKGKAFLYSFDHRGKRKYGKSFLAGSPIADATNAPNDLITHGDDLAYVFGQNTINGETLGNVNGDVDEEDERVVDIFTTMIADFARNGNFSIFPRSNNNSWLPEIVPTYSSESNTFVSITSTPRIAKGFRYCEMGLWTGLAERLQSSTCSIFKTTLDTVGSGVKKTLSVKDTPFKFARKPLLKSIYSPFRTRV